MRKLPLNMKPTQKKCWEESKEWFGDMKPEELKSARKIALHLMGRNERNPLSEEEKKVAWYIRQNRS